MRREREGSATMASSATIGEFCDGREFRDRGEFGRGGGFDNIGEFGRAPPQFLFRIMFLFRLK